MGKSYVIFWSVILTVCLIILIGSIIYIRNSLIPKQIKTTTDIIKVAEKIATKPKSITKKDVQTIGDAIVSNSNPFASFIPASNPKDSLIPKATHRIFFGIEKTIDNNLFYSKVSYMHRLGKTNFYLGGGLSVPITKDSLISKSKISIGVEWQK